MAKKGLGRGLDALLADNEIEVRRDSETPQTVRISDIEPAQGQPRKSWVNTAGSLKE